MCGKQNEPLTPNVRHLRALGTDERKFFGRKSIKRRFPKGGIPKWMVYSGNPMTIDDLGVPIGPIGDS